MNDSSHSSNGSLDGADRANRGRRLAGEFFVIVVGVLVALWIDAGWSWVQDRQDERVLLEDLRSDFEANYRELGAIAESHRVTLEVGNRFLTGGLEALNPDSLDEAGGILARLETFNPRLGALESAISSGRIDLIRDDRLRAELAAWPGYLSDAAEEIEWVFPSVLEFARPIALAFVRSESALPTLQRIAADPEALELLALKTAMLYEVEGDTQALLERTEAILRLLGEAG